MAGKALEAPSSTGLDPYLHHLYKQLLAQVLLLWTGPVIINPVQANLCPAGASWALYKHELTQTLI